MFERNLVVGPFQCNCRLIACPRTGEAVLIDSGDEAGKIIRALEEAQVPSGAPIQVKYLFHTHGHLDHIGATRAVKLARPNAKIAIHRADEELYKNLKMQGQLFSMQYDDPLAIDHYLEDEEEIKVGDLKFKVIHTAGHSPGSVCLSVGESLYSGDTLFQGSVGRTDLWGADQDLMFESIRTRLLTLDDDTRVCPGHGPETKIGIEKRSNPFLK